jgi:hypothetical protein
MGEFCGKYEEEISTYGEWRLQDGWTALRRVRVR